MPKYSVRYKAVTEIANARKLSGDTIRMLLRRLNKKSKNASGSALLLRWRARTSRRLRAVSLDLHFKIELQYAEIIIVLH